MTAEEERRIRERAYGIWEQEGRPHGRDLDHRLRAEAEIAAERAPGGAGTPHRPDDRERLSKAAEALFTPKQSTERGSGAADKSVRKPRVLPSPPNGKVDQEEIKPTITPKPVRSVKIARSQFARIRILVRYGMTVRQVAEVYGVDLGEIERILRTA